LATAVARRWHLATRLLPLALAGASVGCQNADFGERRLQMRDGSLRWTADVWAKSEESRPERLGTAVAYIQANEERHAEALDWDAREARRLLRDDVDRWQQRQPLYWKEIGRILGGRPDEIERYAIIMFY
jgi:hypothetical protein